MYMDDPATAFLRRLACSQRLQAAHTGPEPLDPAVFAKQIEEELAKEDRDAVYYPVESPKGRELRDAVLAIEELMAEIFMHCLPRMPVDEYSWPSPSRAPLLVASVCRRWRRVALSTPTLWNSFPLGEEFSLRLFRLWMERSGEASTLHLSADSDSLEVALPYSRRWGSLKLDLDPSSIPALAAIQGHMPRLRRLFLKFPLDQDVQCGTPSCDVFETAPNLCSVVLKNPPIDFDLPCSQLLDLGVFGAPADYLLRVSQLASNLTELKIGMDSMSSNFLDMPLCTLVHLEYLWASDLSLPNYSQASAIVRPFCQLGLLLSKFSCPALNEIELHTLARLRDSDIPTFKRDIVSFLARSPLIAQMKIQHLAFNEDILLSILAHVPALEKFTTNHKTTFSTAFFKRLTYVADAVPPPLCPRLRSFDVRWCTPEATESASAFVDMVVSRWRVASDDPIARLEYVSFNYADDPESSARLAELTNEGLEIVLRGTI
ncbi:hypothetical protein B0H16DRAFT_1851426 [Mycena metata]|uniref:F-box domain-containing protein n=1 Tax=Mycena metata TaxID=1033252 RepID=A0AAD7N605_9AGAR|nr:hypothetical protein B0H16DRAFT_1851426 [Mycena metata]